MRHHLRTLILLLPCAACGPPEPLARRLERELLVREKAALEREVERTAAADTGSGAVIVVPAKLVDELLTVALPVQTVVADRFRITADSARVDFRDGLGLIRLAARVEWVNRENVSARIQVIGALQVLDIQASEGTLTSRIEILGFETQEVRVGALSPRAGRLLDEFAKRPASDLNELLSHIEIPVRLVPNIPLPAVEEPEISIAATEIPLMASIREVRVGGGRLLVYVGLAIPEPGT